MNLKLKAKKIIKNASLNLEILSPLLKNGFHLNRDTRILLVKQTVYQDLYCCSSDSTPQELVFSSLKRTGPVGLFTRMKADFAILETISDSECQIWKQKAINCKQMPIEFYEKIQSEPYLNGARGHKHGQKYYSEPLDSIDWDHYDIVISYDISIPKRITQQHPNVVWCYYISEPCMPAYKSSQKKLIEGYDLFLNERFRKIRLFPRPASHEIDFPYFIQYSGCFHDLLSLKEDLSQRKGIILESHTSAHITENQIAMLNKFGPVRKTEGTVQNVVKGLIESKYFARMGGRSLWGNAMIEAIAAGCLAIGNPDEYKHVSLFTPATSVKSFEALVKQIQHLENHPAKYLKELYKQRKLLDHLCFYRPLAELLGKSEYILKRKQLRK
ncbi:MAG: hypothetical protein K8R40_12335 [Anaerolineaceae bacterium]|nr:hypothetical protein [Anaerolineaceae bacterium]